MRKIFLPLMLLAVGCSAPRHYGYFGSQSYRFPVPSADVVAGKAERREISLVMASAGDEENQLRQIAVLSSSDRSLSPDVAQVRSARKSTRLERTNISRFATYSAPTFSGLDDDLRIAIILGAAGLTGLFLVILSQIFGILGGVLLIGGVIFFTRWILRQ